MKQPLLFPWPGKRLLLLAFLSLLSFFATGQTITTVAGNGTAGFSGDGGPATSAQLSIPISVAVDAQGNLYIADARNNRIRKVASDGTITTVAGTNRRGLGGVGDGGPATSANLSGPISVAVDAQGNLYIADRNNQRIRKVASDGTITTVAGTGTAGFSGDGGPATSAQLYYPRDVAVDGKGNLFIIEENKHCIRKVASDGTITTVAGTGTAGFSGDGGPATSAQLDTPFGIATDELGNLFIADLGNSRVRRVAPDGTITTVAGTGTAIFSGDGGPATSASVHPLSVAVDGKGNLFIVSSSRIRKVASDGTITTVAGTGTNGYSGDGGPATGASLRDPRDAAVDALGNLFIADTGNDRIRKVACTPQTFYADADKDGYGNPNASIEACTAPANYVANATDCNDDNAAIHPGALDRCDGIDNDCDGQTDEDRPTLQLQVSQTNPNCFGGSNGTASVTVTGGSGTYTYNWEPGTPTGDGTSSISGLSAGDYTLHVTDSPSGCVTTQKLTLTQPPAHPDYAPLVDLYNATNGANWTKKTNWLTGCDPCAGGWDGVTCSNGRVTQLDLNNNGLSGTLPASLSTLTNLQQLLLHTNQLSGSLPGSWSALTNLQKLYLYNNQLSGSLPGSWSAMSSLQELYLSNNQLSGSLPESWSALTNLQDLGLQINGFSGSLPESWSALTKLQLIYLNHNQLSGGLPSSWSALTGLVALYLHNNSLSGGLPQSWSAMTNLLDIRLHTNQLSGGLPGSWSGMSSLFGLELQNNQLSGCFPASYTVFCGDGKTIDFSGNAGLPGGGNFSAFCSSGTGQCTTLSVSLSPSSSAVCASSNVTVSATVSGAAGTPTYQWKKGGVALTGNTSATTATLSLTGVQPGEAGSYTVVVTDGGNSVTSSDFTLTVNTPPTATPSQTNVSTYGGQDGTASVVVSGGSPGYTYDWSPGTPTGEGTSSISGLSAGGYSVLVTDAAGCTVSRSFTLTEPAPCTPATSYLSDLNWVGTPVNGWGPVEKNKSNGEQGAGDGRTLGLNGTTYPKGLGVHSTSEIVYNLGGTWNRFKAAIGIDDEITSGGSVIMEVWADGFRLFQSALLTASSATVLVDVDITGRQQLKLIVTNGDGRGAGDHADWADARLENTCTTPPPTACVPMVSQLSDLKWVSASNGWGPVEKNRSNGEQAAGDGRTLRLNGTAYAMGLGVHSHSEIVYNLSGSWNRFKAVLGIDDEVTSGGSVIMEVWADNQRLFQSPMLTATSAPLPIDLDVTGKQQLKLIVTNGDGRGAGDHADWADARLETTCPTGATRLRATAMSTGSGEEQLAPLRVYPNPASAHFTLELRDAYRGPLELTLLDVHGRGVRTQRGEKSTERFEQRMDVSTLPSGVYVLRVTEGEQLRTQRLVIRP